MSRGRSVDAGGAFVVWASATNDAHAAADAQCPHAASVDMLFDTLVPERSIVLSVREAERSNDGSVHATLERIELTCLLESGQCVANDGAGADFLLANAWFETRLQSWMDLVRERAARAAAQEDRCTSALRALAAHEHGKMISFDELFPADWDLIVTHEGVPYWVIDQYCVKPNCDCGEIAFEVHELLGDGTAPKVGLARINVRDAQTKVRATSSLIIDIYNSMWADSKEKLRSRLHEVRRVTREGADAAPPANGISSTASLRTATGHVAASQNRSRPTRNEPCPCGSGKKFKRCCLATGSTGTPARS